MSVVFTRQTQSEDPTTGIVTPTESTITGSAIKIRGRSHIYRSLELIESLAPTLFFTPATYGDRIKPGDTTVWNEETYTAKDCDHIEPDGVVIATRVIIVK
jgi:hypothetical protein